MREMRNVISRKRVLNIAVLTLGVFIAYVVSFFVVRKHFSITVDLSFNRLHCCYFSDIATVNRIAFYAYLPCIAVSGGVDEATLNGRSDAVDAALKHQVVYFYEPPHYKD